MLTVDISYHIMIMNYDIDSDIICDQLKILPTEGMIQVSDAVIDSDTGTTLLRIKSRPLPHQNGGCGRGRSRLKHKAEAPTLKKYVEVETVTWIIIIIKL